MTGACPWCNAPRTAGPSCPRCGANYAKAEQIRTHGRAQEEAAAPVPVAGVIVGAEHRAPSLQRIFLAMPIHELGHAVTAWFCGYFAVPTLWRTLIPEERGVIAPVLLAAALGFLVYRAYIAEKTYLVLLGAILLVVQGVGTFLIKENSAEMLFTFGGDGMGMVLASALMCTFFFGKRTQLYKGWLRWGFLAIGAAAFADMFGTWAAALRDHGAIPFGEIEGVGLSDPMRLVEEHGWTAAAMVRRYVTVGIACLGALALVYAWGVRLAWRKAKSLTG